jgi:hypothetical protein
LPRAGACEGAGMDVVTPVEIEGVGKVRDASCGAPMRVLALI